MQGAFTHHLSSPATEPGRLEDLSFFDPGTFRQRQDNYTEQTQAQMGSTPGLSSVGGGANLTLEEAFGGFTT